MNKGILLITVILFFPAPGLASLSEAHKADELRDYVTAAKEFWPLRSDLERAVDSCTQSVHRDEPDFEAYNEGSSVIPVSYTHLRAHETPEHLVCRLLLEKKKKT